MKTMIKCAVLLIVISSLGIGQTLPDAEKQRLMRDLQFDGFLAIAENADLAGKVQDALIKSADYRVAEAIPFIESRIWSYSDGILLDQALRTLYKLDSPNLRSIAKAVVDTAEKILLGSPRKNKFYFGDPKGTRHEAIYYLFKLGDFTYADRFVSYAQEKGGVGSVPFGISMAGTLGRAEPAYRQFVKNQLLAIMYADTSAVGSSRRWADVALLSAVGGEAQSELTAFFIATEDRSGVNATLASYISTWRYPPFESALKLKLSTDREGWNHYEYVKMLLEKYGTPVNYRFVQSYIASQQDELNRGFASGFLISFVPDTPSVSIPVGVLLDTLTSYKAQCYSYQWIGDAMFASDLDAYLQSARRAFVAGDLVNCARQVRTFQRTIDATYRGSVRQNNSTVTIEGWKFLYHGAQYILDRLPAIPPYSDAR